MTLGNIITNLKYSELANLSVKDNNEAVTTFLNSALIEIYDRFKLKSSEYIIPLKDNIVDYPLPYDLMTIEALYDENGDEFTMNDETNRFGVFQSSPFTLQVANPSTGASIGVVYKASPEYITYVDETTLSLQVELPVQLLEPLYMYTALKAHMAINADMNDENNTYYLRYEASCKKIEGRGTVRDDVVPSQINQHEGISEVDVTYEVPDLNLT